MLVVFALIAAWGAALFLDLPRRDLLGLLAGIWGGTFAIVVLLPDAAIARGLGWTWQNMLLVSIAAVLIGFYAWIIRGFRARSGVARLRHEADAARLQGQVLQARIDADHADAQLETALQTAPETPFPAQLSDDELDRYLRHIVLREIGGTGQKSLHQARVLIVGAGGLGAPLCLYLAGAGVGRITLADDDRVSLSNLHRQVIFTTADVAADGGQGASKTAAAAKAMQALNPYCRVTPLSCRITADDADFVRDFDLVIDGTDNYASRAGVNRACVAAGVPLLAGSIAQWDGQVTIYDPARGAPCLACLFPNPPAPGMAPSCAEGGVAGPLPGVIGTIMAMEAVKFLTGAGEPLIGRMLIWDGLGAETRNIRLHRDPSCKICGTGRVE